MKNKLFSCLILAWIILPLTGKDFIGGPETVPQGWNFHKPDSKTYYFSGNCITGSCGKFLLRDHRNDRQ